MTGGSLPQKEVVLQKMAEGDSIHRSELGGICELSDAELAEWLKDLESDGWVESVDGRDAWRLGWKGQLILGTQTATTQR